jgi:hypothetical protein
MKKEKRFIQVSGLFILSFILIQTGFSGCKKDGPTQAVITVNDSLGRPVQGATVILWQDTAVNETTGNVAQIRETLTTDAAGKAEFEFALEAFLNLEAYKNADTARGFVRLEEHKTVFQSVTF